MGRKKFKKTLTAKDAKDAKENRGETNFGGRMLCLEIWAHGYRPLYPVLPLTFLCVPGVLCGECLRLFTHYSIWTAPVVLNPAST
jgi:hypothetical protein